MTSAFEEKLKLNIWDDFDDVVNIINLAKQGKWRWIMSKDCKHKYINIRVDTRAAKCILLDENGERIDIEDIKYQRKPGENV